MEITIGLPNTVTGVRARFLAGVVAAPESQGPSGRSRLVYPAYEAPTSLAAAAALTEHVRLATQALLAPWRRNPRCWPTPSGLPPRVCRAGNLAPPPASREIKELTERRIPLAATADLEELGQRLADHGRRRLTVALRTLLKRLVTASTS